MSDHEIRSLERQLAQNPSDPEVAARLFNARRRAGIAIETHYGLQNSSSGKYLLYWYPGNARIEETKNLGPGNGYKNIFKTREAAYNEVRRIQRGGFNIDHYRIVEIQTLTLETPGPLIGEIGDQIEMELLQAKKEAQISKLKELETKEQELLEKKKRAQQEKLKKIEAAEAKLQKKIKSKGGVDETKSV
jgi:hypothetical protein